MTTLPIIDLSHWWEGTPTGRRHVATAVDQAMRDVGFLLLTEHRIPSQLAEGRPRRGPGTSSGCPRR